MKHGSNRAFKVPFLDKGRRQLETTYTNMYLFPVAAVPN